MIKIRLDTPEIIPIVFLIELMLIIPNGFSGSALDFIAEPTNPSSSADATELRLPLLPLGENDFVLATTNF